MCALKGFTVIQLLTSNCNFYPRLPLFGSILLWRFMVFRKFIYFWRSSSVSFGRLGSEIRTGGREKSGQRQLERDFSSAAACSCYCHFESHFHNIWACDGCSPRSQTSGRWCRATTDLIETDLLPADGSSPYFTERWNKKKKDGKCFEFLCVLSLYNASIMYEVPAAVVTLPWELNKVWVCCAPYWQEKKKEEPSPFHNQVSVWHRNF